MNSDVRDIVESLEIKKEKEELKENRERLFKLKCLMNKMTFDRNVGLYAFYTDKAVCLAEESVYSKTSDKEQIYKELEELEKKLKELEKNPKVMEFKKIYSEYYFLLNNQFEYYMLINIDLRRELSYLELPNIYVKQPEDYFDMHIVDGTSYIPGRKNDNSDIYLIEPFYDMNSNRDFRHFYNRTSFKYLEGVCEDYSLDLENKKLGKVKVNKLNI